MQFEQLTFDSAISQWRGI